MVKTQGSCDSEFRILMTSRENQECTVQVHESVIIVLHSFLSFLNAQSLNQLFDVKFNAFSASN